MTYGIYQQEAPDGAEYVLSERYGNDSQFPEKYEGLQGVATVAVAEAGLEPARAIKPTGF